jgi:cytidylate kinase
VSLERLRVVTISRQYGSGGAAVATAVAALLGWRLLDKELIERVARAAGVEPSVAAGLDERLDPWLHRLARPLWQGGFEGTSPVSDALVVDAERLAVLTRRIVEEAAAVGSCVIVGRGSACALAGRADAFHVFVYAPRSERALRLRERLGSGVVVDAAMDSADRERAAYVRRHYGREWTEPELYHLMVNATAGVDAATAIVLAAAEAVDARA